MSKDRSVWLIDACGSVLLLALLSVVGWYAFLKPDTATSRVRELDAQLDQTRANLSRLQTALDRQTQARRELLATAEQVGRLPSRSPIERDLESITELAVAHHVNLLEVAPISTVSYPNVVEHRYVVKTSGTYADHVRFLQAFENCDSWADVPYFKLARLTAESNATSSQREGELTVSFFSTM